MTIYLVIGLPGSGKTEYCKSIKDDIIIYDDKLSELDYTDFYTNVRHGLSVCLNDTRLCYFPTFQRLMSKLHNYNTKIIVFKNQPLSCIKNVQKRFQSYRYINDIKNYAEHYDTSLYPYDIILDVYSN